MISIENYVFVKRDDIKPQTQNVNKKSSENITPKVVHEEPKKANLPVIESSIQIEPQKLEKLSENKTTIPNPNNLYSLFQQEISELLSNGHDENPSNEEKNMHHFQ